MGSPLLLRSNLGAGPTRRRRTAGPEGVGPASGTVAGRPEQTALGSACFLPCKVTWSGATSSSLPRSITGIEIHLGLLGPLGTDICLTVTGRWAINRLEREWGLQVGGSAVASPAFGPWDARSLWSGLAGALPLPSTAGLVTANPPWGRAVLELPSEGSRQTSPPAPLRFLLRFLLPDS